MAITSPNPYSVRPHPVKATLSSNYIDFTSSDTAGWAQQYVPDLLEKEAEVFGNRSISGLLEKVGAEEAMTSDQVIWSEQGRLHLSYVANHNASTDGKLKLTEDADGNSIDGTGEGAHSIRVGDTVIVSDADKSIRCYVAEINVGSDADFIQVYPYSHDTLVNAGIALNQTTLKVMVFGSEFAKGVAGQTEAVEPQFKQFNNKPIIIKDMYQISGSDASQIGWVEVGGEDGQNGYLWYLKAEGDTRTRFTDYLEMAMIEAEKSVSGANAAVPAGTEGLFKAIKDRGHQASLIDGSSASNDLAEFDLILKEFDKNGAIEENMMYLGRDSSLAVDDMLASLDGGSAGSGSAYGVFNNSMDMALNLGFKGFRRGSYDFYKSDWKYLNDAATGGFTADTAGNVRGVIIPAGVSSVYDQTLGKNIRRPFLHVRYRSSAADDRRFKTWTTGSVGANITSDIDKMAVHYLSERCLVVQGANNFVILN